MAMSMALGEDGTLWVARADSKLERYAFEVGNDQGGESLDNEATDVRKPEVRRCWEGWGGRRGGVRGVVREGGVRGVGW